MVQNCNPRSSFPFSIQTACFIFPWWRSMMHFVEPKKLSKNLIFLGILTYIPYWSFEEITFFRFLQWVVEHIFLSIMKCIDVSLQIICLSKWFVTRLTFVISVAFMDCLDVLLQMMCLRKWFVTRFTFVIFLAFMNCVDVFL